MFCSVIELENIPVACEVNTSAETIEIFDEEGNVVNNIHDLPVKIQNELIQQSVVGQAEIPLKNAVENQAQQERRQRSRKRKIQPNEWKATVRKNKCQSGKEYVSVRGKVVKAKSIQTQKIACRNVNLIVQNKYQKMRENKLLMLIGV